MVIAGVMGAIGMVSKVVKSPLGQKALGFVGGLFNKKKRKKKAVQKENDLAAMADVQNTAAANTGIFRSDIVAKDGNFGDEVAEKVDGWLGKATKSTREITTGFDTKSLMIMGGVLAAVVIVGAVAFKR